MNGKNTRYSAIEEKLIRMVAYLELYGKYSNEYHLELKEVGENKRLSESSKNTVYKLFRSSWYFKQKQ